MFNTRLHMSTCSSRRILMSLVGSSKKTLEEWVMKT